VHYKALLDPGEFLGPQDFQTEREVTISRAVAEGLADRDDKTKTKRCPMIYIKTKDGGEYPRKFKVPKSVLYGLSLLLGTETDAWAGQKITIFSTFCMSFGDKEECLRVRFPAEIDQKIRKWLKKRKASPSAYMLPQSNTNAEQAPE
jgi:hypothetical protein